MVEIDMEIDGRKYEAFISKGGNLKIRAKGRKRFFKLDQLDIHLINPVGEVLASTIWEMLNPSTQPSVSVEDYSTTVTDPNEIHATLI